MKFHYLGLFVLVVLCATESLAAEKRKRKKHRPVTPTSEPEDLIKMMEKDDEAEVNHPETEDGIIDNRLPYTGKLICRTICGYSNKSSPKIYLKGTLCTNRLMAFACTVASRLFINLHAIAHNTRLSFENNACIVVFTN